MNNLFSILCAVLWIMLFFNPLIPECFAEDFMLEEIIVQGERELSPEESLDIRDIRETPAKDLGEALGDIDGFSFIRKGAIANDIVLRGFNRDNLNVLIDGARIYGACPNRMDSSPFHVDFTEIKKVTVVKGPFDVKNAGSLGGIVNAETLTPEQGLHGNVVGLFGSYENINTAVRTSYATKKYDALFGYSYKYSLPYKDTNGDRITELYSPASPNRYRSDEEDEKAYSMNTFWTKLGVEPFDGHRMEVSYTRQEADDVAYPYLLMDAVFDDTNRVNWIYEMTRPHGFFEKASLQIYWNNVRHDMTDSRRVSSLGSPAGYSMRTFAKTETYGGRISFESDAWDGFFSYGIDYYMRNWKSETTLPTGTQDSVPDVDIYNVGLYTEYTYPFDEEILFTIGCRLDHTGSEAGEDRRALYQTYHGTTDTEEDDSFVSANVQMTYSPAAESLEYFVGAGLSVRPPDPVESYFALERPMTKPNWVGNPNLDPVKNREIDVGVKFQKGWFQGKFYLFYSDVKDYITVLDISGTGGAKPARSYKNVDATLYGGECTVQIGLPWHFLVKGGLAYTWGRDDTLDEPLQEISPLEGKIAFRYDRKQWFAELKGVFADEQGRVNSLLQEEKTAGWGVAHLTTGIEYKNITMRGGIQNIFDKQYSRHLSYQRDPFRSGIKVPEIGRSFFISLSLRI